MTQAFSYYTDLSIRENLDFIARIYAVPDRPAAVARSLKRLGLQNRSGQLAGELSGGWKQRLALAACLIHAPRLLLLDEPTAGVDPKARREFWDEIHRLAAEGITILVTTHYMDEAERCGDVAIIDHGKLITRGSPRQIVERAGAEKLVVQSEDDARLVEKATGLGLAAKPGAAGVEVSGERAEVMLAKLAPLGLGLREVSIVRPRLEDAFVALTGRDIRDEPDAGAGNHAAMRTQLRARGRKV
jgi:ABC-2 type transport system ATP-binding protein